ncbi:MAG: hypothetical protein QM484_00775 [Woeseiaceae bacterium]
MQYLKNLKQIFSFIFLLIFGLTAISCNAESNKKPEQAFSEFWKEFRTASLNNNITRVIEITKFPFSVKGELDMDGSTVIDKVKFKKRFKSFMEQDIRENLTPESMHDYIKKNGLISPRIDDGQTSVALFSFELIDGKWYFVRVYVEEV